MRQGDRHRGPHLLLVFFGELTGYPQGPIAQHRQNVFQEIQKPVGRFKQHHGALFTCQLLKLFAPVTGLGWQEPLEAKAAAGQAAAHQGGGDGTGAWNANHRAALVSGFGHQVFAWIGDARQAGIAHHRNRFAGRQGRQ